MKGRFLAAFASLAMLLGVGGVVASPAVAVVSQAPSSVNADPYKGSPIPDRKTGKIVGDLGTKSSAKTGCGLCREYAEAFQFVGTGVAGTGVTSAYVDTSTHNPFNDNANDGHTLWEISIQGKDSTGGNGNIVEIGWRNPALTTGNAGCSSTTNPCLFLYSWVKGVGQGYGPDMGSNYVDNPSEPVNHGTALAVTAGGASPTVFSKYGGRYMSTPPSWCTTTPGVGAWVMSRGVGGTTDIACIKSTLWTAAGESFTDGYLVQAFDEIAGTDTNPCSDMGSGIFGVATTPSAAQWVKNYTIAGPTAPTASWGVTDVKVLPAAMSPNFYRINRNSSTEYRSGGPGADVNGGTVTGTVGNC